MATDWSNEDDETERLLAVQSRLRVELTEGSPTSNNRYMKSGKQRITGVSASQDSEPIVLKRRRPETVGTFCSLLNDNNCFDSRLRKYFIFV